jgi:hypothetical protein
MEADLGRFIREERACLDLLEMFLMEVSRSKLLIELEKADGDPEALVEVAKGLGLKAEDLERFFEKTVFKDDPEAQKILRAMKASPSKVQAPV